MKYQIKFTREWATYVTIDAESEDKAQEIFNSMLDNGDVYELELKQNQIESEDIQWIRPLPTTFQIPKKYL